MDPANLYPYLLPGLFNAEQERIAVLVGHGVYAVLFEDHETENGIVHAMVTPRVLSAAGLSADEAHRIALENLERFAESDQLSAQMLGNVGDPFHFLLYSDHPRAAACLRLPGLYDDARELLETDEIVACAAQREALIVAPKRDRVYREALVVKLREIESDTQRPISFELFELTPDGVRPFVEG